MRTPPSKIGSNVFENQLREYLLDDMVVGSDTFTDRCPIRNRDTTRSENLFEHQWNQFWSVFLVNVTVLAIYIYLQYYLYNIIFDNDISDSDYIKLKTPQGHILCLSCAFCIVSTRRGVFSLCTPCYTLQHDATRCNTLQHAATRLKMPVSYALYRAHSFVRGFAFAHTATHSTDCNTLQHAATRCNTLQPPATCCNTLQHPAIHCNTLQHTLGAALLVSFYIVLTHR